MGEIKKCECTSSFQDEKYGKGMRIMNSTSKGLKCTACSKMYAGAGATPKSESKGKPQVEVQSKAVTPTTKKSEKQQKTKN